MLTPILKTYPLSICLALAGVVSSWLGIYLVSDDAIPLDRDGLDYACRAFALYGFLHSGQWSHFWDLLTSPKQGLLPLHYILFFLVPPFWVGTSAYMSAQLFTTYFVLAYALWKLCRILKRPEWSPPLFLLCGVQNLTIDPFLAFHIDMLFFAFGTLALAWQMEAWEKEDFKHRALSGFGLGLLFWIKPANAVIFAFTYLLAEAIHRVLNRIYKVDQRQRWPHLFNHFTGIIWGLAPIVTLAFACGAGQTVVRLIHDNEATDTFKTILSCSGLLRFFYFPFCLAYFYHVFALTLIFGFILLCGYLLLAPISSNKEASAIALFIPILCSYFIWGEIYSFIVLAKILRSLLLELPIIWISLFWLAETCRFRISLLSLAALFYSILSLGHLSFNLCPESPQDFTQSPDSYDLKGNWLSAFPQDWHSVPNSLALAKNISSSLLRYKPEGAKIGLNTEIAYLNYLSFYWLLNKQRLLEGKAAAFRIDSIFHKDGRYFNSKIIESDIFIFFTLPQFQTNALSYQKSEEFLSYCEEEWYKKDKIVNITTLRSESNFVYAVEFRYPLSPSQLQTAMISLSLEAKPRDDTDFDEIYGRHYSLQELGQILRFIYRKRFM